MSISLSRPCFFTGLVTLVAVVAFTFHSCVTLVVWKPRTVFFSPVDSLSSYFGLPIAIDGDTVVVGATQSRVGQKDADSWIMAYIYKQDGAQWKQQAALRGSGFRNDVVIAPTSIDISGDTIAIGALESPEMDVSKQFIYIFIRKGNTWIKQAKLASPDPARSFSGTVALDGDTLVASGGSRGFSVFVRDPITHEWSYQGALALAEKNQKNNFDRDCYFGPAVDISGDTVVIGSTSNFQAGCAHVFVRDPLTQTWRHQAELKPQFVSDSFNGFGRSVAIDKDTILVGAANEGHSWRSFGAVYAYRRDPETKAWERVARLWPKGGNLIVGAYSFGASTAIKGNAIAVGVDSSERAVYLFNYDRETGQWSQRAKITPNNPQPYGGLSPALTDQYLAIGDTSVLKEKRQGGFYVFNLKDVNP